jgi:YVTN family beta-propeller protein
LNNRIPGTRHGHRAGSPLRFPAALLGLGLALAAAVIPASALDCSIQAAATSTVGAATSFTLDCEPALAAQVAWEFGDGKTLDYAEESAVSHAFAAPGSYTVFARIEGEDVPASTFITVLNALAPSPPTHSGTLLLDRNRGRLWNVNVDNHSVTVIDEGTRERIREIPVGRAPRTLAQDKQGRVWVVNQDDATLTVLDGTTLETRMTIPLPYASRPFGICFDPAGENAYVTLEALGALLKLDPATGGIRDSLALFPTPRGIAVAPDGKTLWVTRFISPRDHGEVAQVAAHPLGLAQIIALDHDEHQDTESNGRGVPNAISSLTISPDGLRAWVPFKKDNTLRGTRKAGGGGPDPMGPQLPTFETTVRTAVGQINLATGKELPGLRIDLDNRSMACAVAFAQGGAFAFVATETSNEIAVINAAENVRITAIEPRENGRELGPDGLAVSAGDSLLYVHDFLSREIAVYGIGEVGGSNLMPRRALIPTVERERLAPEVLRGKQAFYNAADPRMSRHKYLSCAVCHLDGGADGRVWDFTHKGEGLRRTPSLLGKAGLGQGPLHWSANFDEVQDFEHDMRDAFQGTGFLPDGVFNQGTRNRSLGDKKAGLSPGLDDLAAYVTSLSRARPSPYRRPDGSLTDEAREGEKIFLRPEVGCAICHPAPRYTDSRMVADTLAPRLPLQPLSPGSFRTPEGFLVHDVGTLRPGSGQRLGDTLRGIDTPTLKGLWEIDGYLHGGTAATLMEVITTANPGDRHGMTSGLTTLERNQLVAFLKQIDDAAEPLAIRGTAATRSAGVGLTLSAVRAGSGVTFTIMGAPAETTPGTMGGSRAADVPVVEIMDLSGRAQRALLPARRGGAGQTLSNKRTSRTTKTAWTVHWDGRDPSGRPHPPGMFLVQARQAGGRAVMAMTWIP